MTRSLGVRIAAGDKFIVVDSVQRRLARARIVVGDKSLPAEEEAMESSVSVDIAANHLAAVIDSFQKSVGSARVIDRLYFPVGPNEEPMESVIGVDIVADGFTGTINSLCRADCGAGNDDAGCNAIAPDKSLPRCQRPYGVGVAGQIPDVKFRIHAIL